ncbi:MAG: cyclophilin-like fold protein [Planctomycetota bacterium]|jgi:hypothetical protein
MKNIRIIVEDLNLTARLNDTETADKIYEALPLEGAANVWGEEIYFPIRLQFEEEPDARTDVEVGELGYWPAGPAFCIFFGPTPVSVDEKPRAYSPVNIFGQVSGDAKTLRSVPDGAKVLVEKAD